MNFKVVERWLVPDAPIPPRVYTRGHMLLAAGYAVHAFQIDLRVTF